MKLRRLLVYFVLMGEQGKNSNSYQFDSQNRNKPGYDGYRKYYSVQMKSFTVCSQSYREGIRYKISICPRGKIRKRP